MIKLHTEVYYCEENGKLFMAIQDFYKYQINLVPQNKDLFD